MIKLLLSVLLCLISAVSYGQELPKHTPDALPATVQDHEPTLEHFETMQTEPDNFMSQLLSMAATIGVLVGLIMIMTWVLKRLLNNRIEQINSKSGIKVLETRNISPKSAIHVVDVYGKNYVVVESVNGVTTLGEIAQLPPKTDFEKIMQNKNTNS